MNLANKMEIKYYENLIKYIKKTNSKINYDFINDILSRYSSLNKTNVTETEVSPTVSESLNKSVVLGDDSSHYRKPWSRLNNIHKIIKLKEWVNNLEISSNDKDKLKEELVGLIKVKILTKKEKVKYDEVNGKVISINDLIYKDGSYSYPL
jgi:hypothetical protein